MAESDMTKQRIWAACMVLPQLLAIASTIFRFIYRKRNQGLWWDDHFALISLVLAFISFMTSWFALIQAHTTLHIVGSWLFTLTFPTLVWTSRISLALSIARIMPRQHPIFSLVICLVYFFGAIGLALLVVLTVATARNTAWLRTFPYVYIPARPIAIFILSGDLVGDILVITIPLRLFWHAKLEPIELFLVKIGFTASILVSTFSIVCTSFLLAHIHSRSSASTIIQSQLAQIEICLSLMACNALVIITFLYRYFRRQEVEQLSTTDNKQTIHTNPSNPITSSNLQSSLVLTEISDMVGGHHTFSCDY